MRNGNATMIRKREYPSQERLKSLFEYNDGNLYWNARPRSDFKTSQGFGAFNTQCLGRKANTGKSNGYEVIKINGSMYLTHRLIYIWWNGQLDDSEEIDHKDNSILHNRIENLRKATRKQNCLNTRISCRNTSGVKGVSWDKNRKKWQVQVVVNGKKSSGRFESIEAAEAFAKSTRERIHGEFHNHG